MSNRDAFPLSPLQSGMLYQSLLGTGSPEFSGYDVEQLRIDLSERMDWEMLADAWSEVAGQYAVLSSRFIWKGVDRPEQTPQPRIRVPLTMLDWSGEDASVRRAAFLKEDRRQAFRLDTPPLMRITVALLDEGRAELYWTVHHILVDGRSFAPVLSQVFQCYQARMTGVEWIPALVIRSYGDYVRWLGQLSHVDGLAYFKALLSGKTTPTPLPLADARPRLSIVPDYNATEGMIAVSTYQHLLRLCQEHQTSVGCVIQAAWGMLLARITGDKDVVFGVTRSCRHSALGGEGKAIIGPMINTLPMRVSFGEQDSLGQMLSSVRQQWLRQREIDQTPLLDIQSQSDVAPGVPLFETLVMYDNQELNQSLRDIDASWAGRRCAVYEQPSTPLNLIVTDCNGLHLKLLFDGRRFGADSMRRLMGYLQQTLESMTAAQTVADIDILPADERQRMAFQWNQTELPYSDSLLIHQLFEQRAEQQPEAIAVEVDGHRATYAEVEHRANQLAHALRARGAGPGRFVGVCLSRSADLVVALMGIAKSGAAYLPIDPEYPSERIVFMIEDAVAELVVTESQYASLFTTAVLCMGDEEIRQASGGRLPAVAESGDICYAIYTSGSTGKPKGVILTHGAVVNTLEWVSRTFQVGPGDRALFVTSPCFDLSVYDVFGILGAGATVVVATSECLREPRALVRQLTERGITIWDSAPAALQRLTAFFPQDGGNRLRLVMLSGDWIPITLPDAVRNCFSKASVMSLGGATEAAIWSNWFPIEAIDPAWTSIPYGRPIQNAQYYILDKRLKPVPVGVTGDLYISGTCLAQGYLNRPELTAERFVSNPFRTGERMYRTGDLARFFPDGNIEFLGRDDFQVKIRGYRIELGEIESVLSGFPAVHDVLCSTFNDASGARALVAYVTPKTGFVLEQSRLRDLLQSVLPDFMVPARIMILAELPLSSNGKIDRKALPSPLLAESTDEYLAPDTDAEKRMAEIWQQVLRRDRIGCNDRFFALGGDSLLAVSLVVAIEQEFNVEFPLSRVLHLATMGAMAGAVASHTTPRGHLVCLNASGTRPPLFLFSGAGGFGFFFQDIAQRLGPDQPVYALHAIGAEGDAESPLYSIEEMARIYIQEINEVCPHGPLIIGGYSFGALVAYEVSKQMIGTGRNIPVVISFDGPAPGHPKLLPLLPRIRKHLADWWKLESAAKRAYLHERASNIKRRIHGFENDVRLVPEGINPVVAERLRRVAVGLWHARNRFKPSERIQSDLLLLRTEVPLSWPGCHMNAVYGWNEFVSGKVHIENLSGAHLDLFSPVNCELITEAIQRLS